MNKLFLENFREFELADRELAELGVLDRYLPDHFPDMPHFWVQPMDTGLRDFLRRYSECGGTHHLALVMGDEIEAVGRMAEILGLNFERV